jgi:hypothetical protein
MFKNRSFQVKMVKDANDPAPAPTTILSTIDFKALDRVLKDYAVKLAVGGVLVYAAVKTIDTASTVTVNLTNPANR